jgi:hypothetical protein
MENNENNENNENIILIPPSHPGQHPDNTLLEMRRVYGSIPPLATVFVFHHKGRGYAAVGWWEGKRFDKQEMIPTLREYLRKVVAGNELKYTMWDEKEEKIKELEEELDRNWKWGWNA